MLNSILTTSYSSLSCGQFLLCSLTSLALGLLIAAIHSCQNHSSLNFTVTLSLLPIIIQVIIMLVNGNLGTGVAVMGAFSLVRFRSLPGDSREIGSIFLAMAIGIATGMGYLGIAIFVLLLSGILSMSITLLFKGTKNSLEKSLRITIPENLDYCDIFDDIFRQYTTLASLTRVKTVNMGSLFELQYQIRLRNAAQEKEMIDAIRCRNGNLTIVLGRSIPERDML